MIAAAGGTASAMAVPQGSARGQQTVIVPFDKRPGDQFVISCQETGKTFATVVPPGVNAGQSIQVVSPFTV